MAKKAYHHGDLRRALIDASLELIQEKGAQGLTLREAARRVGVSHAAPYRHFADKEALLAAVAEEGFRGLHDAMVVARDKRESLVEKYRATGVAYVEFAVAKPNHFGVMFGPQLNTEDHPALEEAGKAAFDVLFELNQQLHEAGRIVHDPMHAAFCAWSIVHGLSVLLINNRLPHEGSSPSALAELVTSALRDGLLIDPEE